MIRSVSTANCSSAIPASAMRMRRWPSKWNGLVTTPTVRMPRSLAQRATTGAAPVPVPPPMPAVTNTMWAPERWSRISSSTSSAAARPTSGCEPAPRPSVACTPIWITRSALELVSACASVLATTNSTPCSPAVIMLLTALPPAPPTPNTVIRGFSSRMSGILRLMLMGASSMRGHLNAIGRAGPPPAASLGRKSGPSEALAKPSSDPGDVAARPCHELPRSPRFEVLEMRHLGIDQKTRGGGESRGLGGVGQSGNAQWPPDPHGTTEHAGGQFRQTSELARTTGENDSPARLGGKRRGGEPIAHHFQDFLHPRLDDAGENGTRHELGRLTLVATDRLHADH